MSKGKENSVKTLVSRGAGILHDDKDCDLYDCDYVVLCLVWQHDVDHLEKALLKVMTDENKFDSFFMLFCRY